MLARLLMLAGVGVAGAQQVRYDGLRRRAEDRQPRLHRGDAHHVVYLLEAKPGVSPVDAVRTVHRATGDLGEVKWIYAGRVVADGVHSSQFEPARWDAAVIMQFSSAEYHELLAESLMFRRALEDVARVEAHGFTRNPWGNLAVPQGMLAKRVMGRVRRSEPILPLTEADPPLPGLADLAQRLLEADAPADRPGVVISLVKRGSASDQTADRRYTDKMLELMAEGGFGPLHLGTMDGELFDLATVIAYPSVEFFARLLNSSFMAEIAADRATADTETVITVPILDRL